MPRKSKPTTKPVPNLSVDTSLEDRDQVIRNQAVRMANLELQIQTLTRNLIAARVEISTLEIAGPRPRASKPEPKTEEKPEPEA